MIKKFLAWLFCLLSMFTGIVPASAAVASAAETPEIEYTSVLDDLQKDATFDAAAYPYVADDYSLQVITIAESINDELFIYVYQPAAQSRLLEATSINISIDAENVDTYYNYTLSNLSSVSVFQKYKVNDFTLPEKDERVYEISSIFRPFDANIDTPATGEGQTISEVSYPVGKRFAFSSYDMSVTDIELINVTEKFVGFVRYDGGSCWWGESYFCDSHFIAFSTYKQIDKLLEADVYFKSQFLYLDAGYKVESEGEVVENYSYMTEKDAVFYSGTEFWTATAYDYSWKRIQNSQEFIASADFSKSYYGALATTTITSKLDESAKQLISSQDWVLRFYESPYKDVPGWYGGHYEIERVFDVSILRLKFKTDGKIFKLGVVDNKQTGSKDPINTIEKTFDFNWTLIIIAAALVLFTLLLIFSSGFRKVVFWIVKVLVTILAWPVLLTILIVQKVKGG